MVKTGQLLLVFSLLFGNKQSTIFLNFLLGKNSFVDHITFTLLEGEKMKYELFLPKYEMRGKIAGY